MVIGDLKRSEDALKAELGDVTGRLGKSEERFNLLKEHAEGKLQE